MGRARFGDYAWLYAPSLVMAVLVAVAWSIDSRFARLTVQVLFSFVVLACLILSLVLQLGGRRPASFAIGNDNGTPVFVAPVRHRRIALALGFATGGLLAVPVQGYESVSMLTGFLAYAHAVMTGLVLVMVPLSLVVLTVQLRRSRPLMLRPDGIACSDGRGLITFRRRRFLPWDAIDPHWTDNSQLWGLVLPIVRPDLVASGPPRYSIATQLFAVDHRFLVHAIQTYVRYPALRATIGTPEGLAHLTRQTWNVGPSAGSVTTPSTTDTSASP